MQCDYCGEIFETTVFCYKTSIKTINKNSCNNKECKAKKTKETNMFKYGVDNTSKLLNVQEKIHNTNLKRYGIKNACQNSEVKAKRDATMLERYGTTIPLKNKEILERIHQTNIEKYGVSTPMESYELKQHYRDSIRKKYGVNWISQNIEVRQKQIETCNKKYGVDNPMQSSEFKQKEIKRAAVLKKEGYKTMRIISHKDKLPPDKTLLSILSYARTYFSEYPHHSWCDFKHKFIRRLRQNEIFRPSRFNRIF